MSVCCVALWTQDKMWPSDCILTTAAALSIMPMRVTTSWSQLLPSDRSYWKHSRRSLVIVYTSTHWHKFKPQELNLRWIAVIPWTDHPQKCPPRLSTTDCPQQTIRSPGLNTLAIPGPPLVVNGPILFNSSLPASPSPHGRSWGCAAKWRVVGVEGLAKFALNHVFLKCQLHVTCEQVECNFELRRSSVSWEASRWDKFSSTLCATCIQLLESWIKLKQSWSDWSV